MIHALHPRTISGRAHTARLAGCGLRQHGDRASRRGHAYGDASRHAQAYGDASRHAQAYGDASPSQTPAGARPSHYPARTADDPAARAAAAAGHHARPASESHPAGQWR